MINEYSRLEKIAKVSKKTTKKAVNWLKDTYLENKSLVDTTIIGTASFVGASEVVSNVLNVPIDTGALITSSSLIYSHSINKFANWLNKKTTYGDYKAAIATYLTAGLIAIPGIHKLANLSDNPNIVDFASNAFNNSPEYLAILLGTYAGSKVFKKVKEITLPNESISSEEEKIKPEQFEEKYKKFEFKEKLKSNIRTAFAGLGLVYLLSTGVGFSNNSSSINKEFNQMPLGILVSKDKIINDGDLMNIDIFLKKNYKEGSENLKVKYYMQNTNIPLPKLDSLNQIEPDYYENMIFLGERNDMPLDSGKVLSGFFEFDSKIENNFEKGTAYINPLIDSKTNKKIDSGKYKFLVELWDGDKKIGHKWWGSEKQDEYFFNFKNGVKDDLFTNIKRIDSKTGKKVFIYKQALSSSKMERETLEVADYLQPHFYDFSYGSNKSIILEPRTQLKTMRTIQKRARDNNIKVIPMIGAFNKNIIDKILDNPNTYSQKISDKIKSLRLNGVTIDFESVKLGKNDSNKLIHFMKILRGKLPKGEYKIAIAVSPRFEGSEKGHLHHGFYNYKCLAPNVDFLEIMAYDFHINSKRDFNQVLPQDMFKKVLEYSDSTISNDKKVILMPLYGYVWNSNGTPRGTLSARNNKIYLDHAIAKQYMNGELRITTKNSIVTAQDARVFYKRFKLLEKYNVLNAGGWRQTHGTKGIFNEYKTWKKK